MLNLLIARRSFGHLTLRGNSRIALFQLYNTLGKNYRSFSRARMGDIIVWIDCEMTGLNVFEDTIIEICCIITDDKLNILDRKGFESVIHKPKSIMDNMNEWCIEHHGKSGLTKKVLESDETECSLKNVQKGLLDYIKKYCPYKRYAIMAGNTIYMDRFFMTREFPEVIDHLHYRVIDVSSFDETCRRLSPVVARFQPKKTHAHTARSDILESIKQLKWFNENYLKSNLEFTRDYARRNKSEDKY